jgi:phage terminase Nu1 subunit (DNA packaging protein)
VVDADRDDLAGAQEGERPREGFAVLVAVHKFPEETGGRSPDLAERDVDVDQQVIIALLAELAAVGARAGDKLQSLTLGTWPKA